ncbi:MAG: hypothetical protein BGO26_04960 [Actinobacteria bacterium 69-20]|nr:MAG: hypothetical protein BGO26_04960 [Actinobacteria bacterium 69-20]
MAIRRLSLREQVTDEILARLARGQLVPGSSINEVQLASELNISRTPLREALIGLQRDGVIVSEAGKGFSWAPVSMQEFKEITPIIAALEALALKETPVDALTKVASKLLKRAKAYTSDVAVHSELISTDDSWHAIFLAVCPNRRLVELIATQKTALRRYERLVVPDDAIVHRVAQEHLAIAQCLADGDKDGAIAALHVNWEGGRDRLVAQLEEQID